MSDYTPTTEEVVEALKYGSYHRVGYGTVRMGHEELYRWLERERETAALNARIEERDFLRSQLPAHDAEVRAAVLAEQGEPDDYWVLGADGEFWASSNSLDDARHYLAQEPEGWIVAVHHRRLPVEKNGESE